MSSQESASEGLRIGDAERERVREVLQGHAADGRLTLDELSDRLGEVYAARTAPDLDRALRDLPPQPGAPGARPGPGRWRASGPPRGGWRPGPPRAGGRRAGRRGPGWPVAPAVLVAVLLGVWAIAATAGSGFFFPWPLLLIAFFAFRGFGRWGGGWGACGPAGPGYRDEYRRERRGDEGTTYV